MEVITSSVASTASELIIGTMVQRIADNGVKIKFMVLGSIHGLTADHTRESGLRTICKALVSIRGAMADSIKVNI